MGVWDGWMGGGTQWVEGWACCDGAMWARGGFEFARNGWAYYLLRVSIYIYFRCKIFYIENKCRRRRVLGKINGVLFVRLQRDQEKKKNLCYLLLPGPSGVHRFLVVALKAIRQFSSSSDSEKGALPKTFF